MKYVLKKKKIRGTTSFPLLKIKTQNRNMISSPKLRKLGENERFGSIAVWREIDEREKSRLRERTQNWETKIERERETEIWEKENPRLRLR